jgi:four helix bundle protein
MLRSSVSVASNIAEGAGRLSRADLCRFLGIARGSLHELAMQIEIAARCQLIDGSSRHSLEREIALISTGLNRWIAKLK